METRQNFSSRFRDMANLILSAKKYQIPLALINARITSKTFKRNFFPNAAKKFWLINLYLCSNRETKTNLEKLDLSNIYYKGNIKLIGNIKKTGIKNINENILNKKNFGLQQARIKVRIYFV